MRRYKHCKGLPQNSGFTLVELLTVIAIVAVLVAILIPVVSSIRNKAAEVESVSSIRTFGNCVFLNKAETGYLAPHKREIAGLGYQYFFQYFLTEYLDYNMDAVKSPIDNWDEQTYEWQAPTSENSKSMQTGKISYGRNSFYPRLATLVLAPSIGTNSSEPVKRNYYPPNEARIPFPDQTVYFTESQYSAVNAVIADAKMNFFYQGGTASPAFYFDGHVEMVTRAELLGVDNAEPLWDEERINIFWYGNPEGVEQ